MNSHFCWHILEPVQFRNADAQDISIDRIQSFNSPVRSMLGNQPVDAVEVAPNRLKETIRVWTITLLYSTVL